MQFVELAYRADPGDATEAIAARAAELLGGPVDVRHTGPTTASLWHPDHPVTYDDGRKLPPSTTLVRTAEGRDAERCAAELQQSWSCPEAAVLLEGTTHTTLVTEVMAGGLPAATRLRLFHGVLQAAIEVQPPAAVIVKHCQQVLTPELYLESCGGPVQLRHGVCNARLFNVSRADDAMVMDTRGLTEVGLPDLQCHFRGLEPGAVAGLLHDLAAYLIEHGPVIGSGHTVSGLEGNVWSCRLDDALVEPERPVLDLDPGPHAAGQA